MLPPTDHMIPGKMLRRHLGRHLGATWKHWRPKASEKRNVPKTIICFCRKWRERVFCGRGAKVTLTIAAACQQKLSHALPQNQSAHHFPLTPDCQTPAAGSCLGNCIAHPFGYLRKLGIECFLPGIHHSQSSELIKITMKLSGQLMRSTRYRAHLILWQFASPYKSCVVKKAPFDMSDKKLTLGDCSVFCGNGVLLEICCNAMMHLQKVLEHDVFVQHMLIQKQTHTHTHTHTRDPLSATKS